MSFQAEVWNTLSKVDCSDKTESKSVGNTKLTYLSWAWAWGVLMEHYPESTYEFDAPHVFPDGTGEIWVTVTVRESFYRDAEAVHSAQELVTNEWEQRMWLPILDFKNQPIRNFNAFHVNNTRMRCLTKALAMFGLGHYIYAGEDMPRPEPPVQDAGGPRTDATSITAAESLPADLDYSRRDDYLYAIREALHGSDYTGLFQLVDELSEDSDMKVAVWSQLQGGRGGEKGQISKLLKDRDEPTSSTVSTIASNEL